MPLLTIARLTLHEAARKRLVLAVFILSALVMGFTAWGLSRLPASTGNNGQPLSHTETVLGEATFVILLAWMFSVVLAVGAAFLAAPTIAADVESGVVLAELPRPIRRADLLLGKWLGLATLVTAYAVVAGEAELYVIDAVIGYLPPHPILAVAYLIGQALVLLTVALLCSTRLSPMTGGIIAIVLYGIAWIAGFVAAAGSVFHNHGLQTAGAAIGLVVPTDTLWRGAVYNLEPAAILALSDGFQRQGPFFVPLPPTTANLIWVLCWTIAILALAVYSFNRRDL